MRTHCAYLGKPRSTGQAYSRISGRRIWLILFGPMAELNSSPSLLQMSLLNLLPIGRHCWWPMSHPWPMSNPSHSCAEKCHSTQAHLSFVFSGSLWSSRGSCGLNQHGQEPVNRCSASCPLDSQLREVFSVLLLRSPSGIQSPVESSPQGSFLPSLTLSTVSPLPAGIRSNHSALEKPKPIKSSRDLGRKQNKTEPIGTARFNLM